MTRLTQPLKWHGGKYYLARRIVALMPPHLHYVEPYAGGLAVLLARDPDDPRLWLPPARGVSEVVNDLDSRLANFWRVLRSEELFQQFRRQVEAVPFSRAEWRRAHEHQPAGDAVADAVAFFVDCRQSRSGLMTGFSPLCRARVRRGMNANAAEWLGAVDGLESVHRRLRRVVVECRPALDLIRSEDGPGTLFYLDPPYLPSVRRSPDAYAHEMTDRDHAELLGTVVQAKGKVLLSGYLSELYDRALPGWTRYTFELPNHAAGGPRKRRVRECVWANFRLP